MRWLLLLILICSSGLLIQPVSAQRQSENFQIVDDSVAGVSIGEGFETFQGNSTETRSDREQGQSSSSDYSFFIGVFSLLILMLVVGVTIRHRILKH